MDAYPYSIEYYLTLSGGKPFKEWLDGLDAVTRAKIRIRLTGNSVTGRVRHVGEGAHEFKMILRTEFTTSSGKGGALLGGDKAPRKRSVEG